MLWVGAALACALPGAAEAATLVNDGGRLVYITCSLLADENTDRLAAFRERHPGFVPSDMREAMGKAGLAAYESHAAKDGNSLLLTPRRSGTDGFFVAILKRQS